MRLAKVVQQLVDTKRVDGTGGTTIGATIPYFKFSDFQRAVSNCTDPTGVLLICANPADAIPHCIAHTALLGLSCALLNDEVRPSSSATTTTAPTSLEKTLQMVGGAGTKRGGGVGTISATTSAAYDVSEKSILDVSCVKAASVKQIVFAVVRAAKNGTWLILPEVSALSLATWTEIGRLLSGAAAGSSDKKLLSLEEDDDDEHHQQQKAAAAAAAASSVVGGGGGHRLTDGLLDENSISPHFRLITFLTEKSAALGRTLTPKITQSMAVVDTRGVVRHQQELSSLFSSVVPLSAKQLSLLCVGIGDGRMADSEASAAAGGGGGSSASPVNAVSALGSNASFGTMTLPLRTTGGGGAAAAATVSSSTIAGGATVTTRGGGGGPPPSFFVDWPCAAAYAKAQVTIHSTDSSTTSDFVDAALFALRETLLRSLKDLISTAQRLDAKAAQARRATIEGRAIRKQQDPSELEQLDEMRRMTAETHMSQLEKNPGWIYPVMYDWVTGCAPIVNLEKIPTVAAEELTIEDIVWVHEGVGDATACLRGTWQLAPVCIKCALPSVRPEVTRNLNNKIIVEGRTLLSIRHPSIIAVYGLAELPLDLNAVQGANMILRPLLSAAAMHERWLDDQENKLDDEDGDGGGGDGSSGEGGSKTTGGATLSDGTIVGADMTLKSSATVAQQQRTSAQQQQQQQRASSASADPSGVASSASGIRQFGLLVEPFEMSLEQCLVNSFDKNRPWTVTQFLDTAVCVLRALVHISDNFVHRCICPSNVVVTQGGNLMNDVMSRQAAAAVKLTCKVTQFSAAMPANRRATPPWLVATLPSKIPVRYCAPETFWGQFSPASDMWSFGVMMWAILHYCRKQPYEGAGVDCAGTVSEGVASGLLQLKKLGNHIIAQQQEFFWASIIEPCIQRRAADRPDARSMISTIMLLKVQHKACLGDPVCFEEFGF